MGRRPGIGCIAALVIVVSAGCAVGPGFRRPETAVSPAWMEAADRRVKTGAAPHERWWQVFHDPVLDRLIDTAYRENLSLRIAGVRVLEARARLGIAVGELYPQTQQASGSLQYNRSSKSATTATFGVPSSLRQAQIGLNAVWELDFWGKFRRAVEAGHAEWLASIANYDNAMVSLTADVANFYIRLRTLEKRIAIARRNVEIQRETLKIVEARYRYGTVSQLDLEQAATTLHATEATIPPLETQLRQAGDALSVSLGMPPADLAGLLGGSSEIPASPPDVVVGIPADLLRRRPEIRSAELVAAAQSARVGVAEADLYPAFSLSGNFGFLAADAGRSSLADMFRWSSRTIQAGPFFQWSLFNYGRITNSIRVQDARLQELLIAYQNTVLLAQQEVEDNLAAFLNAQDQAAALARSVDAAGRALDLAVRQYREGAADFTTVLTVQQSLLSVQDNLAAALGNIAGSLVGIYRALGGGWEIREGQDLVPPEIKAEMAKRTDWGRLLAPARYNPPASEAPRGTVRPPDW